MEVVYLDYVLVPLGLLVLVLYHIWLMITIVRSPQRTAIGVNSSSRRRWIYRMMSDPERNGIQAVQGLRNNLMLSTVLATIAITAISQVTSSSTQSSSSSTLNYTVHQYKYFALRLCLVTAFLCNMLCSIYYANVSLLVIDPSPERRDAFIKYVATELNRGAFFFSLGSRAFYFALALWLWTFGPVPMFSGCCLLPFVLYFTDTSGSYSNFGEGLAPEVQRNHDVESIGSM